MTFQHKRIFACAICVLLISAPTFGQANTRPDVFNAVPSPVRTQLKERVKLFIDAYRTKRPDKLYPLLTDDFNVGTEEQFVKWYLEDRSQPPDVLLDFIPTGVEYRHGFDEWDIRGCSKWQNAGSVSASIYAYRRNDDWLFSLIALHLVTKRTGNAVSAKIHDTVPCKGGG